MIETLKIIKEFTGLDFETCDYFTRRLSDKEQKKVFDVLLKNPMWLSDEYDKLEKFSKKYKLIKIEYAGYKRVRIHINSR